MSFRSNLFHINLFLLKVYHHNYENIGNILSLQYDPEYPLIEVHEVFWNPLYVHVPSCPHNAIINKIDMYLLHYFIYDCSTRIAS